ncbi:MAG: lecithin retinol acyltransferase family protein [Myxococcales bacterium]|nr:lecithin retinol acyltransferase family protein [Myxococcales bacterium]
MSMVLKIGDKIRVRGPYATWHYGMYIGRYFDDRRGLIEHAVVHNSKVQHGVVIDSLARFSGGKQVFIEGRAAPGYENVVAQRALALVGTKYDLLGFNCEHLVNLAQTGEHKSQQLRNAVGVAAVAAIAAALVSSGERPRYDRKTKRWRNAQGQFVAH